MTQRKQLTLKQRAERRAKRHNAELLRRNPLLAEEIRSGSLQHWQTSVDEAYTAINRANARFNNQQERLQQFEQNMDVLAEQLRARVAQHVDNATLALLDQKRRKYPPTAVYAHSHWFFVLRDIAPSEAALICENQNSHSKPSLRLFYTHCPRCGMLLQDMPDRYVQKKMKL